MTARRPIHVGCSPLTKKIYAGSKSADGRLWLSDQTDVTTEALLAVAEMIGPGFKQALIATNGGPSFEIEVREIKTPSPTDPDPSPSADESPAGGNAGTPSPNHQSEGA